MKAKSGTPQGQTSQRGSRMSRDRWWHSKAQMRRRLAPLHQALRVAIPELAGSAPLSSDVMSEAFSRAMRADSVQVAKEAYLDANLLKRYLGSDLSDPVLRLEKAVAGLLDSEVRCRFTNQVFAGGLDFSNAHIPLHLLPVLKRARAIVGRILGRFDWEEFPRACGFTSGATTELPRKGAAIHEKWARAAQITTRAKPYADAFIAWAGIDGLSREFILEERNSVFTVPKNFEVDRLACRPVTWNGFLQKGVGKMIRRRVSRFEGLLQPDAQDYHRVLAKIGSATGLLCTRDLVGASDSIALGLVEVLLPDDWCKVLFDLRESEGVLPDGSFIRWEKISSMGNGFTFELETLLFYALVRASCSKASLVSVYGDDIICPTRHAQTVDEVLSFCGFEVNRRKSFNTGAFRESCGGHYFGGVDIKPFYLQQLPLTLGGVINLHNDIIRWHVGTPPAGSRWFDTWRACRQIVPRSFWGPPGMGGCLWSEWDSAAPTYVPRYQAFCVDAVAREVESTMQLGGVQPSGSFDGVVLSSGHFGAYLQKLWLRDPDPWESSTTSEFQITGTRERQTKLYVDRAQWGRFTAETLCT